MPGPGLFYGPRQTAIDLDKVNAVSGETGIMFGNISIQDSAGSYQIRNVWKKTVMRFTNRVQEAIEARKSRFMQQPAASKAAMEFLIVIAIIVALIVGYFCLGMVLKLLLQWWLPLVCAGPLLMLAFEAKIDKAFYFDDV